MSEINPRIDERGDPWCDKACPFWDSFLYGDGSPYWCDECIRDGAMCIPFLRQQRDKAIAERDEALNALGMALAQAEKAEWERDEAIKREYSEGLQKVFWMKKYCVSEACRRRVEPGVIAIEEHLSPYLFQPKEEE